MTGNRHPKDKATNTLAMKANMAEMKNSSLSVRSPPQVQGGTYQERMAVFPDRKGNPQVIYLMAWSIPTHSFMAGGGRLLILLPSIGHLLW